MSTMYSLCAAPPRAAQWAGELAKQKAGEDELSIHTRAGVDICTRY